MDEHEYQHLLQVKRQVEQDLLARPGVHGVSIGYKTVQGHPTAQLAIVVHLSQKRPANEVSPAEVIPSQVQGIPTDVIEHEQPRPHADEGLYLPLRGGCQIWDEQRWWFDGNIGTLGAFVSRSTRTDAGILTNQHVIKGSKAVWQPIAPANWVSSETEEVLSPTVDAAVAWLGHVMTVPYTNQIIDIGWINGTYEVTLKDIAPPGYPVRKRGRTTLLTSGKITRLNWSGSRKDGWNYQDQLFIETSVPGSNFCDEGDSGSVVVNANNAIVGLLWGGPLPNAGANSIGRVLSALNVSVVTPSGGEYADAEVSSPIQEVRQPLQRTPRGQRLLEFYEQHGAHLRDLLAAHAEVAGAWDAHGGNALFSSLYHAAQDESSSLPATLGDLPLTEAVDQIASAIKAAGRAAVAEALVNLRNASSS